MTDSSEREKQSVDPSALDFNPTLQGLKTLSGHFSVVLSDSFQPLTLCRNSSD